MKNIPAVRMFFQKNNNIIPESLPKYDKVVKTHLLMDPLFADQTQSRQRSSIGEMSTSRFEVCC